MTTLPDGEKRWLVDVVLPHRLDGPAAVRPDGMEKWYRDGVLHRDGGPAITKPDGSQVWLVDGVTSRVGGRLAEREGGRVVVFTCTWCVSDVWHRLDWPAVYADYNRERSWWVWVEHVAGGRSGGAGRPVRCR